MSKGRASPLTAAFLWAASMGALYGVWDVIARDKPAQIYNETAIAAAVAGAVAYSERKDALRSEKPPSP
jgi:hypothetical protein